MIIPSQPSFLSAKGLDLLLHSVAKVKRSINPTLDISGILLTMVDGRTNNARDIATTIRENYGDAIRVFQTEIPRSVRAAEASMLGKSVFSLDPHSKLAEAYKAFDVAGVPVVLAAGRRNAFFGQRPGNLEWRLALQEHSVDALDQLGLFWVYHEVVVRPHVVAQKSLERNRDLAVCKPLPLAPCAVLGNGPGLFLRQRSSPLLSKVQMFSFSK